MTARTDARAGPSAPVDGRALRETFAAFPTGVTALAALIDGRPCGLPVSSFTSVSLDPPLVSVSLSATSSTWRRLRTAPRLGISVLGAQHAEACRVLARPGDDRFALLTWHAAAGGAIAVAGAGAWLSCRVEQVIAAGDHELALLRVVEFSVDGTVDPLVFHRSGLRGLG